MCTSRHNIKNVVLGSDALQSDDIQPVKFHKRITIHKIITSIAYLPDIKAHILLKNLMIMQTVYLNEIPDEITQIKFLRTERKHCKS